MSFVRIVDFGKIITAVLNFSKAIENIIEILNELLRTKHLNDFKVLFDLKSVKDEDEEKIAKSFYLLFNDETEYFNLGYENGEIVKKYLDPVETANAINLEDKKEEKEGTWGKEEKGKAPEQNKKK